MDLLTIYGFLSVSLMLLFYTLEGSSAWFVLAFAASCVMASVYGFLQGAWPFGMVEAVWSLVAIHRWSKIRSGRTMQLKKPITLSINLTEAASKPHAAFYFRLLFAVNDLSSTHALYKIAKEQYENGSLSELVYTGLDSYLIQMETGHLFEAALAFIDKVRPSNSSPEGQHPFYAVIESDSALLVMFNELVEEVKNNSRFEQMRKVRNTVLFHYADRDPQITEDGIARTLQEIGQPQEVEFAIMDTQRQIYRYPVADKIVDCIWEDLNGLPMPTDSSYEKSVASVKAHRSAIAKKFLRFAETLFLKWAQHNKLLVD
jgi:hypothetical protein